MMFKASKKALSSGCFTSCLILLSASVLTGCRSQSSSGTNANAPLRHDVTTTTTPTNPKPIVSLVPVIDHSNSDLPWNLSEELTATIHYRLEQKGNVYLTDQQKTDAVVKKLSKSHHPFSDNLTWVKKFFPSSEFVIFMELVEHEEVPLRTPKNTTKTASMDSPAELKMSLRVRVIDLRGPEAAIVLQEMVHDSHHIPKQFTRANFHQVPWGKDSFNISPIGLAHAQLIKEVAARIEDYVLLAKNRIESAPQAK